MPAASPLSALSAAVTLSEAKGPKAFTPPTTRYRRSRTHGFSTSYSGVDVGVS